MTVTVPKGGDCHDRRWLRRDRGRKPLVARFGGIPLRRERHAVLTDLAPVMARTS
ncbi:hypothetical protein [Phytohabitans aurantiacus]|uniref:hypothetical protein n=1 Tax=Phytohabitans aurantiacus TaxID=3016789 RepID=UPI002493C6EB|nr:hypothetical protein [Phytohabitans aurantiacus]